VSGYEIRPATAADAPGIRRLFARAFGKEMSEEEWLWKFERDPDGWFGVVALAGGNVVGNYAGWGMRFLLDGRETLLYSVGDVATDPSARRLGGRGVFRSMADAFYGVVGSRGVPFCFGFPSARHSEISHRLVGSRTLFPIRRRLVPCERFPPPPADAVSGELVGEGFDALWAASQRYLTHAALRDRTRANWRFHARPSRHYRMVWRERAGATTAWAALSVTGEEALLADYLGLDPRGRDLPELFAAAAAEAVRMGANRLAFWESPGGPGAGVIAELPGDRQDAGFPIIVRAFDDEATDRFAASAHLTPALYDVV
jgi:hypothetical protein